MLLFLCSGVHAIRYLVLGLILSTFLIISIFLGIPSCPGDDNVHCTPKNIYLPACSFRRQVVQTEWGEVG